MNKIVFGILASFILAAAICGCGFGQSGAQISGSVTLDGKPLPKGHIVFIPNMGVKGKSTTAEIVDGKYGVIQQVQTLGMHKVDIRAERPTGKKVPSGMPGPPIDEMVQYLHKGYNEQSQLTREIKAGKNTFDFELKQSGP
jgi:hypothetical protein